MWHEQVKRKKHPGETNRRKRSYGKEDHRRTPHSNRQCGGWVGAKKGELTGNTGARASKNQVKTPPQPHRHGVGDEKATNTLNRKVTPPTTPLGGEASSQINDNNIQSRAALCVNGVPWSPPGYELSRVWTG